MQLLLLREAQLEQLQDNQEVVPQLRKEDQEFRQVHQELMVTEAIRI